MTTANANTANTPAQRAMACLRATLNGGYSIRRGCGDEFAQIQCEYEGDAVEERAVYIFDGGDGDNLVLSIGWWDVEFFIQS